MLCWNHQKKKEEENGEKEENASFSKGENIYNDSCW